MKYIFYICNVADLILFLFLGCCLDTPAYPSWFIKTLVGSILYGLFALCVYLRRWARVNKY